MAALRLDRTALAAARKHRAITAKRDLQRCTSLEDAVIGLLLRIHVRA